MRHFHELPPNLYMALSCQESARGAGSGSFWQGFTLRAGFVTGRRGFGDGSDSARQALLQTASGYPVPTLRVVGLVPFDLKGRFG